MFISEDKKFLENLCSSEWREATTLPEVQPRIEGAFWKSLRLKVASFLGEETASMTLYVVLKRCKLKLNASQAGSSCNTSSYHMMVQSLRETFN